MERRVVVTGIGVVSPIGIGKEEFWNSLVEGKSGIGLITRFDASNYKSKIAGEIKNFEPIHYLKPKEIRKTDLFSQYAIAATKEAVKDANLEDVLTREEGKYKRGINIATGVGGLKKIEDQKKILLEKGPDKVSPYTIPALMGNAATGIISIEYKLCGPQGCDVLACASSAKAIINSYRAILLCDAELMITGGSEASITSLGVSAFAQMNALSTRNNEPEKASRPFDKNRDGFVISEGSAILVLESLEHATERNANIYAEIIGYGLTGDGHQMTAPDPSGKGAYMAMKMALEKAELSTEQVDYINAHGTSTQLNDKIETLAIKELFKEYAKKIPISSTKSMTGHLLGAAGGIEAIVCIMTINRGIIPPTINLESPDPECDLDYVPKTARKKEVNVAMSNSFGFGGHNCVLEFKRYQKEKV
jgi:beta-ketoacyl-acyl-carrier-protein synthase II